MWNAAFPEEELHSLISEQWKEMGWQGKDPSTDFRYLLSSRFCTAEIFPANIVNYFLYIFGRGGGFISLENFLFFARNFPVRFLYGLFTRYDFVTIDYFC